VALKLIGLGPSGSNSSPQEGTITDCRCRTPPFNYRDFEEAPVGRDPTNGRYGDVAIETCRACGNLWLTHSVTYEGFSRSTRWYRGLVSAEVAASVTPETAVAVLDGLDWHFAGVSYFGSSGAKGSGPVHMDLF
jgi:hypothetical protein